MTQASRTLFALLGDIEIEISNSPFDIQFSESNIYAEHPRIEGKPGLQYTGERLRDLKLDFQWHVFWTNPERNLRRMQTARINKTVMPLIMGAGLFYGNYVIKDIDTKVRQSDEQGNLLLLECQVDLVETTTQPTTANRRVRIPPFIKRKA